MLQAEESAEIERANSDELLSLLKEKEVEISQLRCDCLTDFDSARLFLAISHDGSFLQ